MTYLTQYQTEIQKKLRSWNSKPLLQQVYAAFYRQIIALIDPQIPGRIVEIGSGIGKFKAHLPQAVTTDLFMNPLLDSACDGYEMPFADGTLSHLILFDVFHHLRAPNSFFREAHRALAPSGRVILLEPYISWTSWLVYGLLHHEPIAWWQPIDLTTTTPPSRDCYAAQGNATRLFFRREFRDWHPGWKIFHARAFSSFSYLLSGGYSKPALYPASCLGLLRHCDEFLSKWPRTFGARCLIGIERG
jgi:SAM-dependent methyltransferase